MSAVDDFAYDLPDERIAQHPVEPRDAARLLDATGAEPAHRHVSDLASLLGPGDVVVVNDTRVLPARLLLRKETGGQVEVMLIEPVADDERAWRALVRPSRRVAPGSVLFNADETAVLTVGDDLGDGLRLVDPIDEPAMLAVAHAHGAMPLPPYITEPLADPERYQTIYARREASVAAPTAGLHFTDRLWSQVERSGAEIVRVELEVGIGTFRPILVQDLDDHAMHAERYSVSSEVLEACRAAERVVAVGTTSVRALESAATTGQPSGSTELFIRPGYDFKIVDVLMTNFHQPKSSLLVMLAAFAGPRWRDVYRAALDHDYRFLSFGDAMLISRGH